MLVPVAPDVSYFANQPARWVRECLHRFHDIDLQEDARVDTPIAVSREDRTIWLPPGHNWETAHQLIDRAALYIQDPNWAPEFIDPRKLAPNVIDLPVVRRVW